MASIGRPVLSRPGDLPRSVLQRLWRRRPAVVPAVDPAQDTVDPLMAAGRNLRQRREALGLSLRQLALQTRISTPVLEALERGWRDRLPEATYLRAMLPLIEAEVELPAGTLAVALPSSPAGGAQRPKRRFTPGSIDVFSSWQGTVLYGLLTLAGIYALNLEQQRLASAGLRALRPVPPLPVAQQQQATPPGQRLLRIHPELRPLELAARGQALRELHRASPEPTAVPGLLELELPKASRVSLKAGGTIQTQLEGASGLLRLPVTPPFELKLDPPGGGSRVLWNGAPLPQVPAQAGVFRLAAAPTPRPAAAANSP